MPLIDEIPIRPRTERQFEFRDEPLAAKNSGKLLLVPMVLVHATLCALVRYQYGQEVSIKLVAQDSWAAIPIFWGIFEFVHPYLTSTLSQFLLSVGTISACAYLIYIANELGYYAVMYQAPPLGSLVIWAFIELTIKWSMLVVCVLAVFLAITHYSL